jgi:hypothetical protein
MTKVRGHHQAVVRKDGPVHAHPFVSKAEGYLHSAACGIPIGPLAQNRVRRFDPKDASSCRRCVSSVTKQ